VVNEPLGADDSMRRFEGEETAEWFRIARRVDPGARLYANERGMLNAGREPNAAHRDRFLRLLRDLLDRGAPLDAIGLQAHFEHELTPPAVVIGELDRFAELGLPIQVTEFDVRTGDEELQADFTRDFLTAAFSHPRVNGFTFWGFWEGRMWCEPGALFRRDWSEKPCARVTRDLIHRRWWTDAAGRTDADGRFEVRAFRGRHEVTIRAPGRSARTTVELPAEGASVDIRLD